MAQERYRAKATLVRSQDRPKGNVIGTVTMTLCPLIYPNLVLHQKEEALVQTEEKSNIKFLSYEEIGNPE